MGKLRKIVTELEVTGMIVGRDLLLLDDVLGLTGISPQEFDQLFPPGSDERAEIESTLRTNRTRVKLDLRQKIKENKITDAERELYNLVATDEERAALNNPALLDKIKNDNLYSQLLKAMDDDEFNFKTDLH